MIMDDATMGALFALAETKKTGEAFASAAASEISETLQSLTDYLLSSRDTAHMGEWRHRYTRQQAVAAGALYDLSETGAARACWPAPLCCTQTVYAFLEEAVARENLTLDAILDRVSQAAKARLMRGAVGRLCFEVTLSGRTQILQLVCSQGDDSRLVLTLLLPSEGGGTIAPSAAAASETPRVAPV